jgi:hypothetical protein
VCAFVGLLLCLAIMVAVVATFAKGSAGCTLASGRSVTIPATGLTIGLTSTRDQARIDAAGHTIVVAPTFLQIDGKRVGSIDKDAKSVDVTASRSEITIYADDETVATWRR